MFPVCHHLQLVDSSKVIANEPGSAEGSGVFFGPHGFERRGPVLRKRLPTLSVRKATVASGHAFEYEASRWNEDFTEGKGRMFDREELIRLFHERALKFGDFTLVSGKKSTYYLDGKQISLHAKGLQLVSEGLLDLLEDVEYDAIGGMSIGADPIIGGVLTEASRRDRPMVGVMVRKEAKGHGTQKFIEGPVEPGMKVVVIDDVVTTGGSSILACEHIQEFGCEVVCVVGIVDRMQGGAANFAAKNFPFRSLLSILDFGIDPPQDDA